MAKKNARRTGKMKVTRNQQRKSKRLQHFAGNAKMATRVPIEGWDHKLTLKQNYKNLGIVYDANDAVTNPKQATELPDAQFVTKASVGLMTKKLDAIQALPDKPAYQAKSMSVQEQYKLHDLIKKHGDDYQAMQRDIKLNVNQDTAKQLEKRITLMKKLQSVGDEEEEDEEEEDEDEMMDDYDDEDLLSQREAMLEGLLEDEEFAEMFETLSKKEQDELVDGILSGDIDLDSLVGEGEEGEEGDFMFFGDEDEDDMIFGDEDEDDLMFFADGDEDMEITSSEDEAPILIPAKNKTQAKEQAKAQPKAQAKEQPKTQPKTQPKIEKGDNGVTLVKPRLVKGEYSAPKVLKRK